MDWQLQPLNPVAESRIWAVNSSFLRLRFGVEAATTTKSELPGKVSAVVKYQCSRRGSSSFQVLFWFECKAMHLLYLTLKSASKTVQRDPSSNQILSNAEDSKKMLSLQLCNPSILPPRSSQLVEMTEVHSTPLEASPGSFFFKPQKKTPDDVSESPRLTLEIG